MRRCLEFDDDSARSNLSKNVHDDPDDSDDDHMESSRIVMKSFRRKSSTHKPYLLQSVLNKLLKMWASFSLPYKTAPKVLFKFWHVVSGHLNTSFVQVLREIREISVGLI